MNQNDQLTALLLEAHSRTGDLIRELIAWQIGMTSLRTLLPQLYRQQIEPAGALSLVPLLTAELLALQPSLGQTACAITHATQKGSDNSRNGSQKNMLKAVPEQSSFT